MIDTPEKPERDDEDEKDEPDDLGYSDQDSGWTLGERIP